jgi:hypothetical protein
MGRGDDGGQGTHRCEHLLVVRGLARGEETAMTHHPPPASQATAREVVGGWNDDRETMRRRRDETRGRRGDDTHPTKHPQPLPRAIARGVERGATSVYGHEGGTGGRREREEGTAATRRPARRG